MDDYSTALVAAAVGCWIAFLIAFFTMKSTWKKRKKLAWYDFFGFTGLITPAIVSGIAAIVLTIIWIIRL